MPCADLGGISSVGFLVLCGEWGRITFGDSIKIILYSFIENFGFRQLINFYRFMAFVNYKSNKNKWGKITRVKNS